MRLPLTFWMAALCVGVSLPCPALHSAERGSDKPIPALPSVPAIRSLKLEPNRLTLLDGRDSRKVLVLGECADGSWIDLSAVARLKPESAALEVDSDGYLFSRQAGKSAVMITAAGKSIRLEVEVLSIASPEVGFVRDIEPILSRTGCNSGPCHGSAKGKNGFKLALRGYDPEYDYQALINDLSGRRFNRVHVDESLMLQKPLADIPHEGRQALVPGSRYHKTLRQWISEGAHFQQVSSNRPTRIQILPEKVELDLPGRRHQFLVVATYPDGSTRDVTREAVLSSNNEEVALVQGSTVIPLRRGEMAVLVRYEGLYDAREVTVMGDRTGFRFAAMPEYNFVDRAVNAKLERLKMNPSELCNDAEFIRRVFLDITGQPPTSEAVRAFLSDPTDSPKKREKLVDSLIGSNAYSEFWANKFADLLQCNSENLGKKGVWVFRSWIRDQFATNRPFDQFARELVLAKGSTFENPAGNYLRALRDSGKMTEDISQTFLGVRFNCNKCHDHPFERWTQNQYYEFGAFFAQVAFKRGTLGRDHLIRTGESYAYEQVSEEVVYHNDQGGEIKHPKDDAVVAPKVPYGENQSIAPGEDRREAFAAWLTSKDNPYFAKSTVNRFWSYFFGRGIIDPVDDIRAGNPASNPALLDALTARFVADGHDVRKLIRYLVLSRTYQLSIVPNRWNEDDLVNFSHSLPRRLSAEQMLDSIAMATGRPLQFSNLPDGLRAAQLPDGMVAGNDFLTLFGRPKRQSACECERSSNVTLSHALNLINGKTLGDCVNHADNRFAKLIAEQPDDQKVIEEIYLSCLCRLPTSKELNSIRLGAGAQRLEGAQDLAWALINSPAFLFNR